MGEEIYILEHIYYNKYSGGLEEAMKPLGEYSSEINAREAIERYSNLPGFCDYSKDCFEISKYTIDQDSGWKEGFFNWTDDFTPPENYDVPYWSKNEKPLGKEDASGYATRLMNDKYGRGNWKHKGCLDREHFKILLRGYLEFNLGLEEKYEK